MNRIEGSTFVFVSSRIRFHMLDRRLLDVMAGLIAEGAHVHLVCRPSSPVLEPARALGVTVAPYRLDKVNVLRTRSRLRKYLRRYQPVLAHSVGNVANVLLRLAAGPLDIPVVNSIGCAPWPPYSPRGIRGRMWRRLDRRTFPRVDAFVADCAPAEPLLREAGLEPRRVEVIVPGVDVRRVQRVAQNASVPRPASQATGIVAYLGDREDDAAMDELLSAIDILRVEGLDVVVACKRDAPQTNLRRRAQDVGAVREVDTVDMPVLASVADACCVISTCPGLPAGILIAGALGKPMVASAVLGAADLLTHNREACYVKPSDVFGLAQQIRALLRDTEWAQAMGERARHRVLDEYSAGRTVREHLELYRTLIAE